MKKFLLLIFIVVLTSCAGYYKQASYVANRILIGMPINDFRKLAGKQAKLEVMEHKYTVYKMNDYDRRTGAIIDSKFFYFDSKGKLFRIDGGAGRQKKYQ